MTTRSGEYADLNPEIPAVPIILNVIFSPPKRAETSVTQVANGRCDRHRGEHVLRLNDVVPCGDRGSHAERDRSRKVPSRDIVDLMALKFDV